MHTVKKLVPDCARHKNLPMMKLKVQGVITTWSECGLPPSSVVLKAALQVRPVPLSISTLSVSSASLTPLNLMSDAAQMSTINRAVMMNALLRLIALTCVHLPVTPTRAHVTETGSKVQATRAAQLLLILVSMPAILAALERVQAINAFPTKLLTLFDVNAAVVFTLLTINALLAVIRAPATPVALDLATSANLVEKILMDVLHMSVLVLQGLLLQQGPNLANFVVIHVLKILATVLVIPATFAV